MKGLADIVEGLQVDSLPEADIPLQGEVLGAGIVTGTG
jgi:hypothetical protein